MEELKNLSVAGVVLMPFIILLIQQLKKLASDPKGNLWLGVSLLLGVAGAGAAHVASSGVPADFAGWLALVVIGLAFGAATSKAYDETLGND